MRTDRWWPEFKAVVDAVLKTPGASSPALRHWAAARGGGARDEAAPAGTPDVVAEYVDLVATHAYRTTDAHVERLRAQGVADDGIFEVTAATAVGAARRRLERALAAIEEAEA